MVMGIPAGENGHQRRTTKWRGSISTPKQSRGLGQTIQLRRLNHGMPHEPIVRPRLIVRQNQQYIRTLASRFFRRPSRKAAQQSGTTAQPEPANFPQHHSIHTQLLSVLSLTSHEQQLPAALRQSNRDTADRKLPCAKQNSRTCVSPAAGCSDQCGEFSPYPSHVLVNRLEVDLVSLHLLVERSAIDAQSASCLLAVPASAFQSLNDQLSFRLSQSHFQ